MAFLASLFFGVVPMFLFAWIIYWLDRYEKEPKVLLGMVFTWGAIVAAGSAFLLNTILGIGVYLVTNSESLTNLSTDSVIAPVIEECLKAFAVLIVAIFFYREFDSLLDGIVYAAITALGFAATENTYYIYTYGYQEQGWSGLLGLVFVRVVLVGWQHPFYTAFTGIGLASARLNRNLWAKVTFPLLGLSVAILAHAAHNTLANFVSGAAGLVATAIFDWSGWLLMVGYIIWAISRDQRSIATHLHEEVALGIITAAQYRTACSAWLQGLVRLQALFSGQYRVTARFYQTAAELAHKKEQLRRLGEEGGNTLIIESLRKELAQLAIQTYSQP